MNQSEFENDFIYLQFAFEHKVKDETTTIFFKRFRNFNADIFHRACISIVETDKTFPRISRILQVLNEEKINIKKERNQDRSSLSIENILIEKIKWPKDLKNALHAKMEGEITQEDLEEVCEIYTLENIHHEKLVCR